MCLGNRAEAYRLSLIRYSQIFSEGRASARLHDMLDAKGLLYRTLVEQINMRYRTNMDVEFVQASHEGTPIITTEEKTGVNALLNKAKKVVIWHQGNHFEALVQENGLSPKSPG